MDIIQIIKQKVKLPFKRGKFCLTISPDSCNSVYVLVENIDCHKKTKYPDKISFGLATRYRFYSQQLFGISKIYIGHV